MLNIFFSPTQDGHNGETISGNGELMYSMYIKGNPITTTPMSIYDRKGREINERY